MGKKRTFTVSWGASLSNPENQSNRLILSAPGTAAPVVTAPRQAAQEPLTRFTLPVKCRAIKATLSTNNFVGIELVRLVHDRGNRRLGVVNVFRPSDRTTLMSRGGATSLVHLRDGFTFHKGDVATIVCYVARPRVPGHLTVQITFQLV